MDYTALPLIVILAFILLLAGLWLLRKGRSAQQASGLPAGEVIYSDTSRWEPVEKSLLSHEYGLVGKPDYLLTVPNKSKSLWQWRLPKQEIVPVEVKSSKAPATPHLSHILQLGTYCLLVESHFGTRPSHGLLHYADATLRIPFTQELADAVLAAAADIRRAQSARRVPRSHSEPARCRACGYRAACGDEAL